MEQETVFKCTAALLCGGAFVTSLEAAANRSHYGRRGLSNWEVIRTRRKWMLSGVPGRVLDVVNGNVSVMWSLVLFRCFASLTFILCVVGAVSNEELARWALLTTLILTLWFHFRNAHGLDGSDQMTVICLAAVVLSALAPANRTVSNACVWFICLQSVLAYVTSGIAKLISPLWRSGAAITGVMETETYGDKWLTEVLARHRRLPKTIAWAVIGFECAFPIVLLLGDNAWVVLVVGLAFHLGNALFMGLNSFVWAFVATYPAIYWCVQRVEAW